MAVLSLTIRTTSKRRNKSRRSTVEWYDRTFYLNLDLRVSINQLIRGTILYNVLNTSAINSV